MIIAKHEADLFFELMAGVQLFVNRKLNIYPTIKSVEELAALSIEKRSEIRKAFHQNISMIDAFVEENPEHYSNEKLAIISGWKNFIEGDFYIERYLKKYAIFIKGNEVYGVLGFYQSFDEMIPRAYLPQFVKTALFPFLGKIVYDGQMDRYNFYFGGGVKSRFRETYMVAKQNNRIIESLDSDAQAPKWETAKNDKNWESELLELTACAKKLRSSQDSPPIYTPAFSLVKASIEFARVAVSETGNVEALYKSLKKATRALKRAYTVLDRQE